MGVANNAAYLAWFEVGRVEYLREIGHSYADVHSDGMDMVVVEAHVAYLRPLRFDETFAVECTCTSVRGASVPFGYETARRPRRVHARRDAPRVRRPRLDAPGAGARVARARRDHCGLDVYPPSQVRPPSSERSSLPPAAAA